MMFLNLMDNPELRLAFFIVFFVCLVPIFILVMIVFIRTLVKYFKKVSKHNKSKTNKKYLDYFGGSDNVISVTKNLSRVTVEVKELELVDLESLKSDNIGVMITGNIVKCSSQAFADQVEE